MVVICAYRGVFEWLLFVGVEVQGCRVGLGWMVQVGWFRLDGLGWMVQIRLDGLGWIGWFRLDWMVQVRLDGLDWMVQVGWFRLGFI